MEKRLHARDAISDPAPDTDDERAVYAGGLPAEPGFGSGEARGDGGLQRRCQSTYERRHPHTLDDRSRDIIESRWLTDQKKALHELADDYGISAERVRQVEANAIKKLPDRDGALKSGERN